MVTLSSLGRFAAAGSSLAICAALAGAASAASDWPSYNRTLTSERYSPLKAINAANVAGLKVICTYDTGQMVSFQTGLVQTAGTLFATTEQDTFSIDPDTCKENWRVHDAGIKSGFLKVNRGLAYEDGRVFRGTADGRVLAYDAKTGKQLWEQMIGDGAKGESVPASPIAWKGMVFIGNAGGDNKGVKGRMYALDARTGAIAWEFYLVPRGPEDVARGPAAAGGPGPISGANWKTPAAYPITGGATWTTYTLDPAAGELYVPGGNPAPDFVNSHREGDNLFTGSVVVLDARTGAYKRHFQLVKRDFHDWDVSTAPTLFTTRGGKRAMAVAPKDGHLYGFDLGTGKLLYRLPMTTIFNAEAPLTPKGVRFCPGSQGGAEWNGPAYDVANNTILTGEVDWCATVHTDEDEKLTSVSQGQAWSGSADGFGKLDDPAKWAGWLTATNADTGARVWRFKAPAPLMGGVTPTAGGVTLFGDMAGNFYAFDSAKGSKLWSKDLGGAVAGGVITYDTGAGQKIAVAAGMTSPIWPTPKVTGRIVVLGLN
jgi:alcohol dehydrogenase (cytochrome c)